MNPKSIKNNNQGMVTIPFLLVLVLLLFFTLSLFSLSMTFVHVSVSQYLSYSAARKFFLSGEDQLVQKEFAIEKYKKLRSKLFSPKAHTGKPGDWFVIPENLETDHLGRKTDIKESSRYRNMFYGAMVKFQTNIMTFHIPGLTKKGDSQNKEVINIGSFLGREISKAECEFFYKQRASKLKEKFDKRLKDDVKAEFQKSLSKAKVYVVAEGGDNGC